MPSNPPDPFLVSREQYREEWVTPGVLILTRGLPEIESRGESRQRKEKRKGRRPGGGHLFVLKR